MNEISLYKSLGRDYFVLMRNNELAFYFEREDIPIMIKKLNNVIEN